MSNLKEIFTPQIISHLKNNKNLITSELLQEIRSFGNEGKQVALDILDIEKDHENYYLDAFGNRISFDGNRRVKKAFTKLSLYPIHYEELQKCAADIHYYKDNYVKIVTPKGVNFPELREYQNRFLDVIIPDENESIVSLQPRQSGKSVTVGIYLSHQFVFNYDKNMGIAANKASMAKEFVDKVKKIFVELPIWMQPGIVSWNKSFIEAENGMKLMSDATSDNAFRGFTLSILVCDETAFIRPNLWESFADSIFPSQSGLAWKKNILISTANGLNFFYDFIKGARTKKIINNINDATVKLNNGTEISIKEYYDKRRNIE